MGKRLLRVCLALLILPALAPGQVTGTPAGVSTVNVIPQNAPSESPEVSSLKAQLRQANEKAQSLQTDNDAMKSEQQKVPQVLRDHPMLQGIVPLCALAFGLIALFWAGFLTVSAVGARKSARAERADAERRLAELKDKVHGYEVLQRRVARDTPAARPLARSTEKAAPLPQVRVLEPRAQVPVEPLPVVSYPVAPEAVSAPVETVERVARQPEPADPRVLSGNLLRDYATVRTLEPDGPELFQAYYRPIGLSCINLSDLHPGETGKLRFREAARGMFLAVAHEGELLVVPALDKDFAAVRQSLEGVFTFPQRLEGAVRLLRPATVRKAGDEWTLQSAGEIACG